MPLSLSSFKVNVDMPERPAVPLLFAVLPPMVRVVGVPVAEDEGDAEIGGVGPAAGVDLLHAAVAIPRAEIKTTAFTGSDLIPTPPRGLSDVLRPTGEERLPFIGPAPRAEKLESTSYGVARFP